LFVEGRPGLFAFHCQGWFYQPADAISYGATSFWGEDTTAQQAVGIYELTLELRVLLHAVVNLQQLVSVVVIDETYSVAVAPTPILVVQRQVELAVG
jgi:hypothetical protein